MFKCAMIDFLFSLIPLKSWQDFLFRRHIQRCPLCQKKMASAEQARSLFIQEVEAKSLASLWPAVEQKLSEEGRKKKRFLWSRLAWIAGAACLCAVVAASVWLYIISPERSPSGEKPAERFQINYIRIGDEPARAYFFKPYGSKVIIVWAEKET